MINMEKSELIPVRREDDVEVLGVELGCRVGELSSTYLTLPLGVPFMSKTMWGVVEVRF